MPPQYFAHYNPDKDQYQSVETHSSNTTHIATEKNPLPEIEHMLWLACHFHDAGKNTQEWQDYFEKSIQNPGERTGMKQNHTTIGGQLVRELLGNSAASEMIQTAIYSHHGLKDCIDLKDDSSLFESQTEKAKMLPLDEARANFYQMTSPDAVERQAQWAKEEEKQLIGKLKRTIEHWGSRTAYGNIRFFLGMYERMMMSLLIDADRRDTEDFMNDGYKTGSEKERPEEIWKACMEHLEKRIAEFSDTGGINTYRKEISECCRRMAYQQHNRYQLSVPTGAGKTLASLRFAVHHALKYKKKRIIYVAPYHSILEQNAEEIREALGRNEIVLEHHCNIVLENEAEQRKYDRVTEDWSLPVIVTTAVQFLNTLFAEKTGNVRRMHSLCGSVLIIDEVQSLPINIIQLFNLVLNYLTEFMDSTVVLCTATQPLLHQIRDNRLLPVTALTGDRKKYQEAFKRTEIIDCTSLVPGGMDFEQAADFIRKAQEKYKSILFIANTKACARGIFERLEQECKDDVLLFHLSTNMCPENRKEVLEAVRQKLEHVSEDKPVICISTQLIEAGVDISFRCVIRSLAGIDSIIQAAGRCNRHKEEALGMVYVIQMCRTAENLSSLKDIRMAQEATRKVWGQLKREKGAEIPLDSEEVIKRYYVEYFGNRQNEMNYPVSVEHVPTNMIELLSANSDFADKRLKNQSLKQAFRTAGELFQAVEDMGKESVVVEYNDEAKRLLNLLDDAGIPHGKKKQILRSLQQYAVAVDLKTKNAVSGGIRTIWGGKVMVLDERYYDKRLGITENPKPMPNLQF